MTGPASDDPDPAAAAPADVDVRAATDADLPAVLGVLDAGALATGHDRVRASVARDDALVAVADPGPSSGATTGRQSSEGTVVGALVLDGTEITGVAVRRGRRDQGIGTALVAAAADRVRADSDRPDRLVAEFDAGVRPFYEALGFAVEPAGDERYRGRLSPSRES